MNLIEEKGKDFDMSNVNTIVSESANIQIVKNGQALVVVPCILKFRGHDITVGKNLNDNIGNGITDWEYNCGARDYIKRLFHREVNKVFGWRQNSDNLRSDQDMENIVDVINDFICAEKISKDLDYGLLQDSLLLKVNEYDHLNDELKKHGLGSELGIFNTLMIVECYSFYPSPKGKLDLLMVIHKKITLFIDDLFKLTGQWYDGYAYNSILDRVKHNIVGPIRLVEEKTEVIVEERKEQERVAVAGSGVVRGGSWFNRKVLGCLFFVMLLIAVVGGVIMRGAGEVGEL